MADVQESKNALWRRDEQIRRWNLSETNNVSSEAKDKEKVAVKFQDGCVFLAACSSGDKKEVQTLVKSGADINTANIDGLTALHQACIDDNLDMVQFLVELGADIDACDNEGWTALHATASCGLLDIGKYLIEKGANVAAVNNDGELAFDLAEGEDMENLLAEEMERQGIDADAARNEEEDLMLRHANQWLNGNYNEEPHHKTGATALHVAAAKGYIKVMNILVQTGASLDAKDFDGWTPLHAAAHWGQDDACKVLVENFCNMDIRNNSGQTALDIADTDVVPLLEELKKTQASLKEKQLESSPLSDISTDHKSQSKRRSSVTRMSGDQKQHLVSKSLEDERNTLEELRKVEEEKDEEKKSESESVEEDTSSGVENGDEGDEEDVEASSESDTEKQNEINRKISDNKPQTNREVAPQQEKPEPVEPTKKIEETEEIKPPPPKSIQTPTPAPATSKTDFVISTDESKEEMTKDTRTLSSTEIEKNAKNNGEGEPPKRDVLSEKNKDTIENSVILRKPPKENIGQLNEEKKEEKTQSLKLNEDSTKPRRILSTSGVGDSTEATKNNSATTATTTTTTAASTGVSSTSSVAGYQPYVPFSRRRQIEAEKTSPTDSITSTTPTSPIGSTAGTTIPTLPGRRHTFEPPKRDEEKEVERKARAKRARETRRSTQGVTKEDIEKAEEALKLANRGPESSHSEKPKQQHKDRDRDTSSDDKSDKENKPEDTSLRYNKSRTAWSTSDLDKKDDDYNSRSSLRRSRENNKDNTYSSDTSINRSSLRSHSGSALGSGNTSSSITSSLDTNNKMLSTSSGEPSAYTGSSYGGRASSGSSYSGRDYLSRGREDEVKERSQPDVGTASPRYTKKDDSKDVEDPSQKSAAIRTRRKRESRRPTGKINVEDLQGISSEDKDSAKVSDSAKDSAKEEKKEEDVNKTSRYGSSRYSEPVQSSLYDSTSSSSSRYGSSRPERPSSYSGSSYNRSYTSSSIDSEKGGIDYKKLYEQEKSDNERLKKDIDKLKQDLAETRLDLDRTKLKTESKTNDSREKRALERRISELEEEVKTIENLKADNQRLKEENGALIRVISKLSK